MNKWLSLSLRTQENLRLAAGALRGSQLRTILTMLIIAVGITALMGMLTVVNTIAYSLETELGSQQGALFTIDSWSSSVQINNKRTRFGEDYRRITLREAERFSREFAPYGPAGYRTWITSVTAARGSKQINRPRSVIGVNHAYLEVENIEVEKGRLFTPRESASEDAIVLIGDGIAETLFEKHENPIGERINLGNATYRVVGVLKSKASTFGSNQNERILVPVRSGLADFSTADPYFRISVGLHPGMSIEEGIDHATIIMRRVRRLQPLKENNFNFTFTNEILDVVYDGIGSVGIAAVLIGLITLLGSAVALMNIMLASVTERTQEIGIRKAIGAYATTIQNQFLIESMLITLIGGAIGVVLGTLVGMAAASLIGGAFTIPWLWGFASLLLSIIVGILAGYIPAKRAAKLDPIVALRYE